MSTNCAFFIMSPKEDVLSGYPARVAFLCAVTHDGSDVPAALLPLLKTGGYVKSAKKFAKKVLAMYESERDTAKFGYFCAEPILAHICYHCLYDAYGERVLWLSQDRRKLLDLSGEETNLMADPAWATMINGLPQVQEPGDLILSRKWIASKKR